MCNFYQDKNFRGDIDLSYLLKYRKDSNYKNVTDGTS